MAAGLGVPELPVACHAGPRPCRRRGRPSAAPARPPHRPGGRSPRKTNAVADLPRLADVRRLASDLQSAYPRIGVPANNAGGIFGDRTKTVDGFDLTFQVD